MSTTTAPDITVPLLGGRTHFLLRRLHSLTGIMFGGYLVVHLLVNATIMQDLFAIRSGHSLYQTQVRKIHELPLLTAVEWTFIFLPFLYHAIYGTWITLTGQPNNNNYGYSKNWLYLLQRISAVIILAFAIFHILSLKYGAFGLNLRFEPEQALTSIGQHMRASPIIPYVVYPLGILASCFHLANGFWTAGITWGLTVSAASQRRWGAVCVALFIVTFGLGMAALYGSINVPQNLPALAH